MTDCFLRALNLGQPGLAAELLLAQPSAPWASVHAYQLRSGKETLALPEGSPLRERLEK